MCVGQVGGLLPHVVVPAIMIGHLVPQWGLSNAQAGLLAASYAAGYMCAVPVLGAMTDRIDARKLLLLGSLLSAAATIAFGVLAQGMISGMLLWALAGIGFAGAYMPGLRALTDRLDPGDASRSVTLYTSSFSLGVGLSFLCSQLIADSIGWRWSFVLTGLGPLVMAFTALRMESRVPQARSGALLDFRPVLRNRSAMGYILGYGAHCFELYGMRTWIVAFWSFVAARHGAATPLDAVTVSVLVTLVAMPASILGNECSIRFGRHRAISFIQFTSAAVALAIGLFADGSPWLLLALVMLYGITVPADSGSLTAGMSASAEPGFKGATMALHSTVGFGLSALAGWAVGAALDAGGGSDSPQAWLAGFGLLAAGILMGPLALRWSRAGPPESIDSQSKA
jgi:MFS family permease